MSFAVERISTTEGVCVAVAGEVDMETGPRLRRAIETAVDEAVADRQAQVIVDLGAVTYLDSSGLAALVAGRRKAQATGVTVTLRHVPPRVTKILTITGLDSILITTPEPTDDRPL